MKKLNFIIALIIIGSLIMFTEKCKAQTIQDEKLEIENLIIERPDNLDFNMPLSPLELKKEYIPIYEYKLKKVYSDEYKEHIITPLKVIIGFMTLYIIYDTFRFHQHFEKHHAVDTSK